MWGKAGGVKGCADGTGHRPSVRFSSFLEEGIDEGQRGHFARFWPILQHAGLEACISEGRPRLIARDALQTEGSLEQRGGHPRVPRVLPAVSVLKTTDDTVVRMLNKAHTVLRAP